MIKSDPIIQRRYYPALDGIRGSAILLVVLYHNFGFINYFFFGWIGVDLFFVLSGYLITEILLNTKKDKRFLTNFYIRRILRIFPLYYLCLCILLFLVPKISSLNLDYYIKNQIWFWTYLQNWLLIFKPVNGTNLMHHLWSLAVEEQFYLIWPLIIFLIKKPKALLFCILILLALILIVRSLIWVYKIQNIIYFSLYTFTRIDGLCIGCAVALLQKVNPNFINRYQPFIVLVFAGLNFLFYFINSYYNFSFPYLALIGYTTFAMLLGLLVHEAVKGTNRIIQTIFTWKPLQFLGTISYGLYIFHWPTYIFLSPSLEIFLGRWSYNSLTEKITISIVCSIVAIIISAISFFTFERYFLKLKSKYA